VVVLVLVVLDQTMLLLLELSECVSAS